MATGTGSHDTVMGYMGYCLGLIDASNTHGTGLHGYLLDGWLVGWLVGDTPSRVQQVPNRPL